MVLGAQAPGRVGRRPFCSTGPARGPFSFLRLYEARLVGIARIELPMAAGVRTPEAVAYGLKMGRCVLDGLRAVQLRRFGAAAVHGKTGAQRRALRNVGALDVDGAPPGLVGYGTSNL
jgi:hypothetical protein